MTLRVLLVPGPPPEGRIENGLDRYLDALVRGMGDNVDYRFLEDPKYARGPERKWEMPSHSVAPRPRWHLMHIVPRSIRLILGYVRETWRLARLLRPYRNRVDLIHVNRVGCEIQTLAARLAGFRHIVATIHNLPGDHAPSLVERLVEWLSFACGTHHIAVADATYESWRQRIGLTRRKTVTIFNGMDPDEMSGFDRHAYRAQFCADPGHTFIIGICARLHRMKGHVVLLEAFKTIVDRIQNSEVSSQRSEVSSQRSEVRGQRSVVSGQRSEIGGRQSPGEEKYSGDQATDNATIQQPLSSTSHIPHPTSLLLLIAGEGPERAKIEAKIADLGLGDHVKMLGHRADNANLIAALDLHVLPSIALECMPYSVIEAMFAGVPQVVSDVGGAHEIIESGRAGRVVPSRNSQALVHELRHYLSDPETCLRDGDNARRYAGLHLTAGIMAGKTFKVYEKVMSKK